MGVNSDSKREWIKYRGEKSLFVSLFVFPIESDVGNLFLSDSDSVEEKHKNPFLISISRLGSTRIGWLTGLFFF